MGTELVLTLLRPILKLTSLFGHFQWPSIVKFHSDA